MSDKQFQNLAKAVRLSGKVGASFLDDQGNPQPLAEDAATMTVVALYHEGLITPDASAADRLQELQKQKPNK